MNTEAASLLQQIVHCPIAEQWYKDVTKRSATNPCHVIIDHQFNGFDGAMGAKNLTDFQVPEPWRGHIQQARLLLLARILRLVGNSSLIGAGALRRSRATSKIASTQPREALSTGHI